MKNITEFKEFLRNFKVARKENSDVVDAFCKVCGQDAFDSPIVETGWAFADELVQLAAKYFDVHYETLCWFIYDAEMGDCASEVEDDITIDSIDSFVTYCKGV